jgi:lactoylglutathione lyase
MVRITDVEESLRFYCDGLGLKEIRRFDSEPGRFSLIFLATPDDISAVDRIDDGIPAGLPCVELTHNWDTEPYPDGRNFGHIAYQVDDIYATCAHLDGMGYIIHRPPRDGRMAFIKSPDGISVELLQRGLAQAAVEPWSSMENSGSW